MLAIIALYAVTLHNHIQPLDVRIVFLNVNSSSAVQIMCEVRTWQWNYKILYLPLQASRAGHLFPRYVWIAYAGDHQGLAVDSTCDSDELSQFLEGVFTLLPTLSNETVCITIYIHAS